MKAKRGIKKETGIIAAIDDTRAGKVEDLASEICEYVDAFKVGYPTVLSSGIDIITKISNFKPVIADFKIADIPYISARIAEIAFEAGAFAVICHAFVGSDTLLAVLDVAKSYSGEVYAVSELSSSGGKEFMQPISSSMVKMAIKVGCHGIIAPATRIERLKFIKSIVYNMAGVAKNNKNIKNIKILSPGVGTQGGSVEAIKWADFIIVGRSIYTGNPLENLKNLIQETKAFMNETNANYNEADDTII